MAATLTTKTDMVRQSSSSTCASHASSRSGPVPYISVMKTQLNFFMTRLLFMQEDQADSLGARQETRRRNMNNSLGNSANFNASGSRLASVDDGGLLGYFDEEEPTADVQVFNDNARILPNCRAKSMPPVPFPPAAPESPRPVEGKEGIIVKTPTHLPVSLPTILPLSDMTLEDKPRQSVSKIAPDQRVFPKNQSRSGRNFGRKSVVRSQSSVSASSQDSGKNSMSKSCH